MMKVIPHGWLAQLEKRAGSEALWVGREEPHW